MKSDNNAKKEFGNRKIDLTKYAKRQDMEVKSQIHFVKKFSGKQLTKEQWDQLSGLN